MITRSPIPARKPPIFPLSKCMSPELDLPELQPEVDLLTRLNTTEGQHPLRMWEYAMAHRAIREWRVANPEAGDLRACDVGGAGSKFCESLLEVAKEVDIVDPALSVAFNNSALVGFPTDLWQHGATQAHDQYDLLTLISVLEHVDEVRPLFRAAKMLLKPGGLLFLTMDCWNCVGPDTAHYNWMRKRIYNPDLIRKLQQDLRELGFVSFGRGDWTYGGDHLYGNYSFASLAMARKPL